MPELPSVVDTTKGQILPKPDHDGFYQIMAVGIKSITLKKDVGQHKIGQTIPFITLTLLAQKTGKIYGIGFEQLSAPGISSTFGKLLVAFGNVTEAWMYKFLYVTLGTIGSHGVVTVSPQPKEFTIPMPTPVSQPAVAQPIVPPAPVPAPYQAPVPQAPAPPATVLPPQPAIGVCRGCAKTNLPVDQNGLCSSCGSRYAEVKRMFPNMSVDDAVKMLAVIK